MEEGVREFIPLVVVAALVRWLMSLVLRWHVRKIDGSRLWSSRERVRKWRSQRDPLGHQRRLDGKPIINGAT